MHRSGDSHSHASVEVIQLLREVPLFADLDDAERRVLASLSRLRQVLPRNNLVFEEGDDADCLLVILEGKVKISLAGVGGADISLGTLGPASVIGEMALLDGAPRSATVRTLEDTRFIEILRAPLLAAMEHDPRLGFKMMKHLAGMLRKANEQIRTLSMSRANIQVLRCLVSLVDRRALRPSDAVVLSPRPTNQYLSERAGCRPETVSRALRDLRLAGHLVATKESITVRPHVFQQFGEALSDLT